MTYFYFIDIAVTNVFDRYNFETYTYMFYFTFQNILLQI